MTKHPLVSIVTPSFNQVKYLEYTLLSVLEQDYPNLEYWVIDGASTDGSVRLIDRYTHRLTGWMSEKDHGQAEAINKGFRLVHGEIVAWLNSDDVYYPKAISRAVEAFDAHPQASFVFSDVDSINERGQVFHRMRYGRWGLRDLMQFKIIGQPGVFIRRSALDQAGLLDLDYHYLLDHHLWLRLAEVSEPFYVKGAPFAQARLHAEAKNKAAAANFGPEAFKIARWLGEDRRFYPLSAKLHRQIWAGAYRLNGYYLTESGLHREGLSMFAQSFKRSPRIAMRSWKRILVTLLGGGIGKLTRKLFERLGRMKYGLRGKGK